MIEQFTLVSALLAGLFGGVHCAGMCGGIVSALSINVNSDLSTTQKHRSNKFLILLFYNLGRITSYSVAGLLLAGTGWWLTNWFFINKAQLILQLVAAVMMLLLGLYLANWSQLLTILEKPGKLIWKCIEPFGRRYIPVTRARDAFLLGIIWGWLPCGLVYTMLIWSMSAGSATQGGLLMLFFGIGTLPNLLLMGMFAQQFTKFFQLKPLRIIAGLVIISFAGLMIFRVVNNI